MDDRFKHVIYASRNPEIKCLATQRILGVITVIKILLEVPDLQKFIELLSESLGGRLNCLFIYF